MNKEIQEIKQSIKIKENHKHLNEDDNLSEQNFDYKDNQLKIKKKKILKPIIKS